MNLMRSLKGCFNANFEIIESNVDSYEFLPFILQGNRCEEKFGGFLFNYHGETVSNPFSSYIDVFRIYKSPEPIKCLFSSALSIYPLLMDIHEDTRDKSLDSIRGLRNRRWTMTMRQWIRPRAAYFTRILSSRGKPIRHADRRRTNGIFFLDFRALSMGRL